jgi:hypothetical protein
LEPFVQSHFFFPRYQHTVILPGLLALTFGLLTGCGGGGGSDIKNLTCAVNAYLIPGCLDDDDDPAVPTPVVIPTINLLPSADDLSISLGESVTLIADFDASKYSGVLITSEIVDGQMQDIGEPEQIIPGRAIVKSPAESTLYTLRVAYDANGTAATTEVQRLVSVSTPQSLTLVGPLTQARSMHTTTLLANQKVLVTGGWSGTEALATAELYDLVSQTWTTLDGEMSSVRRGHTATLLPNGKVLVVGGDDGAGAYVASAEIFDPATNTFTETTGAPLVGRTGHSATLLGNDNVLIAGGQLESGSGKQTELYINETTAATFNTFIQTGSMAYARVGHQAVRLLNGNVFVVGLSPTLGFETTATSFEIYDPSTGLWAEGGAIGPTNTMLHQRSYPAAVRLSNGYVLVSGGTGTGPQTWEVYNPTSGQFETGPSQMTAGRSRHSLTLLADDDILAVGGFLAGNQLATTERFNFNSTTVTLSTWSSETSLNNARAGHTATRLVNDQILILGSYEAIAPVLKTVEVYPAP